MKKVSNNSENICPKTISKHLPDRVSKNTPSLPIGREEGVGFLDTSDIPLTPLISGQPISGHTAAVIIKRLLTSEGFVIGGITVCLAALAAYDFFVGIPNNPKNLENWDRYEFLCGGIWTIGGITLCVVGFFALMAMAQEGANKQ